MTRRLAHTLLLLSLRALLLLPTLPLAAQTESPPPRLIIGITNDMEIARLVAHDSMAAIPPLSGALELSAESSGFTATLLPIVFFDRGSDTLPARYARFTDSLTTRTYHDDADLFSLFFSHHAEGPSADVGSNRYTSKYYEILNVLGVRLRRHPIASIALQGEYSAEPGEGAGVAQKRMERVRNYLTEIWGIAPGRITLLPPQPGASPAENAFRQEEGRRVVIRSEQWEILRPVRFHVVSPGGEEFNIMIDARLEVGSDVDETAGVELVAMFGSDTIASSSLPLTPSSSTQRWKLLWAIVRDLTTLPPTLSFQAFVRQHDGRIRASQIIDVPLSVRRHDWSAEMWEEWDRKNPPQIAFFDAGATTLDDHQRMTIDNLILPRIEEAVAADRVPIVVVASFCDEGDHPAVDSSDLSPYLFTQPDSVRTATVERMRATMARNAFLQITPEMFEMNLVEYLSLFYSRFFGIVIPDDEGDSPSIDIEALERARTLDELQPPRTCALVNTPRAAAVIDYLRSRIAAPYAGELIIDSTNVDAEELGTLPEQRFYQRRVEIDLAGSRPMESYRRQEREED